MKTKSVKYNNNYNYIDSKKANILKGSGGIFLLLLFIMFSFAYIYATNTIPGIEENKNLENLGNITWPVYKVKKLTSRFGYRKNPFKSGYHFHNGIDIGAGEGTKILAVTDGEIIYAGWYGGYGISIMLKKDKYIFLYSHLSPNLIVKKGQNVKRGDVIGTIGPKNIFGILNNPFKDANGRPTNGNTTGPHLHFSVIKNGKFVNPLNYIR